jgi:hypothetical protein
MTLHRSATPAAVPGHAYTLFLDEVVDERPAVDPKRTFVIFMCAYAGDVLAGALRGPCNGRRASLPGSH